MVALFHDFLTKQLSVVNSNVNFNQSFLKNQCMSLYPAEFPATDILNIIRSLDPEKS